MARHSSIVGATLTGIWDQLSPTGERVHLGDERLDGKQALVTGANRGLGKAVAIGLAERGATVHLACRSQLEQAVVEVGAHGSVVGHALELTDPASIAALDLPPLDRVVLNAAVVPAASRTTPLGLDVMFHVNFLANVMLVDRLAFQPDARVVVVGSEAHRSAAWELADFAVPRTYGTAGVLSEYGRSKLFSHTWAVELGRRLAPDVAVHHLCPGAMATDIAREAPGWLQGPLRLVMRLSFQSPEQAARPVLYLCTAPDLPTGTYLHLDRRKDPSPDALDPAHGRALWDAAHDLVERLEDTRV